MMKKIVTAAMVALSILFLLPACKKSDKQPSTLEKIQGKWQLDNEVFNDHLSGQDNITNISGVAGDIADFRTDGKVYTTIQGQSDTSTYALSGETKIVIDDSIIYDIKTLTTSSFVLYNKENDTGTDYYEQTINFKK